MMRDSSFRQTRHQLPSSGLALLLFVGFWIGSLIPAALPAAQPVPKSPPVSTEHLSSIRYDFYLLEQPRPVRIHVLTVDLSEGKVEPIAVIAPQADEQPCSAVRTDPRLLAAHPSLQAFVNTNPWSPWGPSYPINVRILGLAATEGKIRCFHQGVSVWTDHTGRIFIGEPNNIHNIREGVGGFEQILKASEVLAGPGGAIHPRTAIGVNRDGTRLYLAAADGRQPGFSEGMTLEELARFMKELGCWDVANMDGGGSTILGLIDSEGQIQILNNPSGPVRALPVMLTIRLKPKSNS